VAPLGISDERVHVACVESLDPVGAQTYQWCLDLDNEGHGKLGTDAALVRAAGESHVAAVADATVDYLMTVKAAGSQNVEAGHLRNNPLEAPVVVVFVETWNAGGDGGGAVLLAVAVAVAAAAVEVVVAAEHV
jgi:hypothetical protein